MRQHTDQRHADSTLGNANIGRASGMLVNIAGDNLELWEFKDCMDVIYRLLNDEATVCIGDTPNPNLQDEVRVTLIAAGIGPTIAAHPQGNPWF